MTDTVALAQYLLTRLHQLGVRSVHGVPGDFNLTLLDHIEPAGLRWVGNCNELNAGYAADGYARVKGIGALVTTFGVGELSAINAIAGAYAERAPVVHVVGTPDRHTQDARLRVHHTFNDGEYRRFAQMYAAITVAQVDLRDARTAPSQVDAVLRQCLLQSRPVYIQLPVDMVNTQVAVANLRSVSLASRHDEILDAPTYKLALSLIVEKVKKARQPVILVDGETRALGITESVQSIVEATKWPTWTSGFAKGLVDETISNVYGVYRGSYDIGAKAFVDSADLILCFGPHFSSTNTYDSTGIPPEEATISFSDTQVQIGGRVFRDIPVKLVVSRLQEELSHLSLATAAMPLPSVHDGTTSFESILDLNGAIVQDKLWALIAQILQPGDFVMGETGTAGYGVQTMRLPRYSRVFAPATWLSIGYMLPAAEGAALAQRELVVSSNYHGLDRARTVLCIGDGSFQMTVQELGTVIREKLDVIVFLLNNDGYTIERCIHGLEKGYNDVGRWRYLHAPHFLGADENVFTAQVKTWAELQEALDTPEMLDGTGLRMVEVVLDREDVLEGPLLDLLVEEKVAAVAQS